MQRRRLWTRKQVADWLGVHKSTITRAAETALREARVGQRIHIDHPAAVRYCAEHGHPVPPLPPPKPPKPDPRTARAQPAPADSSAHRPESNQADSPGSPGSEATGYALPSDIEGLDAAVFGPLTLDDVARRFGSMTQLRDVVDVVKTIEITRSARLKNEQLEGTLISRDLVEHVFSRWEQYHRTLLRPVMKTATRTAITDSKAGKPTEEIEKTNQAIASRELEAAIAAARRILASAGKD